jgi:putative endonuclease
VIANWMRRWLGSRGERAAEDYLVALGYRILFRGHRSRRGELDLVALDGKQLVFVEVKTRTGHEAGHPVEAVGPEKQRKLTELALAFLKKHKLLDHSARFDVVAITWPQDRKEPAVQHYRNAFEPTAKFQMFA